MGFQTNFSLNIYIQNVQHQYIGKTESIDLHTNSISLHQDQFCKSNKKYKINYTIVTIWKIIPIQVQI